ncbi:hypothetical protein [Haloarcula sp. Atlit-7R]|uniref:hypothetical protein n=1 Tax=Haloarcula sp. Atlit-7R TaxID=2282125 RepID=UPI000EF142A6|nr:hypothetical protein [Haloarcula sp. Atlit-7R]RLM87885.1 hypothetical protein D3D01_22310 [Haloarcula sp. Atlit-7R]
MVESSDADLQVSYADRDALQQMLTWQQNRYHNLQSLAMGFLGASITIVAVIATIAVATYDLIPKIPGEAAAYAKPAGQLPIEMSAVTLQGIIAINFLLSISILATAVIFFLKGEYKLFNLTVGYRSSIHFDSSEVVIPVNKIPSSGHSLSIQSRYASAVRQNQVLLQEAYDAFLGGTLRIPVAILFGIVSAQVFLLSSEISAIQLLWINLGYTVLSLPIRYVGREYLSEPDESTTDDSYPSLAQELFEENGRKGRWKRVDMGRGERLLSSAPAALSLLSIVFWIVAVLV